MESRFRAGVRPEIPPPCSSVHANRSSSPVLCTPHTEVHVEFEASGILTQRPSEVSVHCFPPGAGDDELRRSQRLDQVVDQGWVAYFYFHLPQLLPRVAARAAPTSHSRQKRSGVKGAAGVNRPADEHMDREPGLFPPKRGNRPGDSTWLPRAPRHSMCDESGRCPYFAWIDNVQASNMRPPAWKAGRRMARFPRNPWRGGAV